jgi:DNA-3-methyladenine glycosylase II
MLTRALLLHGVQELSERDARLARIVDRFGPPPLWARPRGYATLVRIILEQQVSLASAAALFERLKRALPDERVTPEAVSALGTAGLQALGFTRQKARYVHELATRITDGHVSLARIDRMPDDEALQALVEVPGIGPWTANIYVLMALRRPDVWPPGDLGLHKSMQTVRGLTTVPTSEQAARFALRWRPWRAVAARLLWHAYLGERSARWEVG